MADRAFQDELARGAAYARASSGNDDDRKAATRERLAAFLSTVPASFHWASFESPFLPQRVRNGSALEQLRTAPDDAAMMFLIGPAGAGKTSSAVARARCLVRAGRRALFLSALELGQAERESAFGKPFDDLNRAKNADVLILDDLGAEDRSTAHVTLIHHRHAANAPTIVTCGIRDGAEIEERYGAGILRRLAETDRALVIRCGEWPEGSR